MLALKSSLWGQGFHGIDLIYLWHSENTNKSNLDIFVAEATFQMQNPQ